MGEKSLDRLYIGNRSAGLTRAYIQFATMPTIPEGSTITSAIMTLHLTSGTSTAANASAYMVTGGEWASGTIQWSNMPAANVLLQGNISHNNVTGYTFSCLSAVQTWYNGDPTGQHNNYGIMLKYANESIDDYNAVYSADYTDADKRPKLTISYTISQVSVVEGYIKKLPFSETTETITWASSDTGIAIATTGGNVIGVKAGTAIVTGTVNGEVMYTYTVRVVIADGVYYIKAGAGLYLGTYGGTTENTPVRLFNWATSGLSQVRQLWKVTYLGGNYYSIRPLHKLDMGLHVTSDNVDITTTAGSGDSLTDVTAQNRWSIDGTSDGKYYINNVGTYTMGLTYPNEAIASGMSVITGSNSGASDSFKWELVPVDDLRTGVVLYHTPTSTAIANPTRYITEGEIFTLSDYNLSPMVYSGEGLSSASMQWTSSGAGVSVVSSTGTVTGLSYSEEAAVITGSCEYGSVQFTVNWLAIREGTYFLQNMETEQFADVLVDEFGSGTSIGRKNFDGANTQRWIFDHLGDGTYSIRIGASETPYYLGVQADSTADGATIVLRSGQITDGMRWKFESVVSGLYYKIVPVSGQLGGMALTAGTNSLQQMAYVNNTYSNKWTIHQHKDYSLMYIGETEGEEEILPILEAVNTAMIDDAGMDGYENTSMTKEEMIKHISSCKIFSCVTHGEPTYLVTSGANNFSIADVNALADDAFDNLQLVYMGACLTGQGCDGADNLVNALYDKGADVVIGFTVRTDQNETYTWTQAFMKSIAEGNSVAQAMMAADALFSGGEGGENTSTVSPDNRHVKGNTSVIPCP